MDAVAGCGPDQARTVLGDLLEAQPGPLEFWFAVLRATVSIARHQPRRVGIWLLWAGYELGFYAVFAWLLVRFHLRLPNLLLLLAVVAGWLAVGRGLGWHRARTSQLPSLFFWTWFLVHDGFAVWGALLTTVPGAVFTWRMQWKRKQRDEKPGGDRPIAL